METQLRRAAGATELAPALIGVLVALAAAVAISALVVVVAGRTGRGGPPTARFAYFEFGPLSDTLYVADVARPSERRALFSAPHAPGWGLVAALSPGMGRVAFTALAPDTPRPGADAPADLWVASLTEARPRLLARGVDLLVQPVWSPDGEGVVVRRSGTAGEYALLLVDTATGAERELSRDGSALFPVGHTAAGDFAFVRLSASGSELFALRGGVPAQVARLGDDLTRDWRLSPDGTRMAFLAVAGLGSSASSRAYLLDMSSGEVQPAPDYPGDDVGPAWTTDGRLWLGRVTRGAAASGVAEASGAAGGLRPPERGFDAPLAWHPGGDMLAVREFDGASPWRPGGARLAIVGRDGSRTTVANGEVQFLGWLGP